MVAEGGFAILRGLSHRFSGRQGKNIVSASLDLPSTARRPELLAAMAGKVVAKAAYVGRCKGAAPAQ